MNFGADVVGSASSVSVLVGKMVGGGVSDIVWMVISSEVLLVREDNGDEFVVSKFGVRAAGVTTADDVLVTEGLESVELCIAVDIEDEEDVDEVDEVVGVVEAGVFSKLVTVTASAEKVFVICTLEDVDAVANFLILIVLNVVLGAAAG